MKKKEVRSVSKETEDAGEKAEFVLRLFITGASPNSVRAVANLREVCEKHIKGRYSLEIVDVYQQRDAAQAEQIVALPMLVKKAPHPERRMIGDMSDTKRVLQGLGVLIDS